MSKEKIDLLFSQKFEYVARFSKNQTFVKPIKKSDLCKQLSDMFNVDVKLDKDAQYGKDAVLAKQDSAAISKGLKWTLSVIVDNEYKGDIVITIKALPLKGKAKALGLKSSFVKDNELILTSPANGNDAIIEKRIIDNDINKIVSATPEQFEVSEVTKQVVKIAKGKNEAPIDNPTNVKGDEKLNYRLDFLRKKGDLEKEFFNKNFKDNIHIQLIYNILDIKKILSLYVDDITYVLCNAGRNGNLDDIMGGTINPYIPFDKFGVDKAKEKREAFLKYFNDAKSYLTYFPAAFSQTTSSEKMLYEAFDALRVLSLCRQFVRHADEEKSVSLYQLELEANNNPNIKKLMDIVENRYNQAWNKLNNGFVKHSQKNVYLIMKALNLDLDDTSEVKKILNEYYRMTVCKENANRGFDFKKLKERLINVINLDLKPDDKSGAHQSISFIINHIISDDITNKYVNRLRSCRGNEEKDMVYDEFAKELKPIATRYLNNNYLELVRKVKMGKDPKYCTNDMLVLSESDTLFDKLVYFLCIFLSPKDTNMLLSSLINKFSNIDSFNHIIKELYGVNDIGLTSEYVMFNDASKYVDKLNTVVSLIRIQKQFNKQAKNSRPEAKTDLPKEDIISKKPLFYDVYNLFGFENCKMDKSIGDFHKEICDTADGKKGKKVKSLRNYIISNFINSNKFRYIVEYANPKDCYEIIQNEKIVNYVLNDIPKEQLLAYGEKAGFSSNSRQQVVNYFVDELKKVNIKYIYSNYDKASERIMMLAGLYLAIIYLVVKQLVRVNSYYSIAFSCLERDRKLYGLNPSKVDLEMVNIFINDNRFKPKVTNYLKQNMAECEPMLINTSNGASAFKLYRNEVVHVNIAQSIKKYINEFLKDQNYPMRSYFELYNFLMQKMFIDSSCDLYEKNLNTHKAPNELINYKNNLITHQTYDKDLLHNMNMPFAYNLARYKNLTIEDIFYDNYKDKLRVKKAK